MVLTQLLPYRYIVDTSSILAQKDGRPLRRKVFKTLWENVENLIHGRAIVMCSENYDEVEDDEIKDWLVKNEIIVLKIDAEVQEYVKKVVTSNPQLIDFKERKSSGDAFLIASAIKYKLTVITEENKDSPKKIPFVCKNLDIPCINLIELCEEQGWSM